MGQSLHIDPDRLHALITELAAVAESAHQDLTELKDALAREGQPWGDDEPGRMVGDTYEPQAKKGLEGYQNLVDNLRALSKGVSEVGDALDEQDQNSGQQIRTTGSNQPVSVAPDSMWPGTGTPRTTSPATDSGSNADNGNTTPTLPSGSAPISSTQPNATPSAYPQPEANGYSPIGEPTPVGPQPMYPDSSTPRTEPDSAPQPTAQNSAENGENAAAPSAADDSIPAAPGTTSPAATAAPRTGDPAVADKPAGTPWSRTPGTAFPPIQSGTPWSGARTGARPPAQVFAPQPTGVGAAQPTDQKREDKPRKKKREKTESAQIRMPTDAAALAAAQELADRHELRIVGFDASGIGQEMVGQLAAAIDNILGKYPFVDLGGIEITELGDGQISRVTRDRGDDESESASTGSWILLDRALVANPAQFSERVYTAIQSGNSVAGSEERPMYSTIVGDLGRILADQAGQPIQRLAQRSLITEYRRIDGPWDAGDTLARIVGGYRRWRDQLGGNSIVDGRFQPRAALVAAFAEVELRGDDACGPARVLYRLLVEGARGRSAPP
ncbi:hypothetical protein OIE68_19550 [Nocardia vinacea]|uniref:hypothetical protein n=1 Tax=Nocardia vinacea TaxID=96468 RepID=UPI002E167911|nr:hypothetical protein OIE68_19550 [Nocardia vinacea]